MVTPFAVAARTTEVPWRTTALGKGAHATPALGARRVIDLATRIDQDPIDVGRPMRPNLNWPNGPSYEGHITTR